MQIQLKKSKINSFSELKITGSKSESNRLLILQKLYPNISIKNLSDSDDSVHMQHALSTTDSEINIGHAGTAMRFLTSYFEDYANDDGDNLDVTSIGVVNGSSSNGTWLNMNNSGTGTVAGVCILYGYNASPTAGVQSYGVKVDAEL